MKGLASKVSAKFRRIINFDVLYSPWQFLKRTTSEGYDWEKLGHLTYPEGDFNCNYMTARLN